MINNNFFLMLSITIAFILGSFSNLLFTDELLLVVSFLLFYYFAYQQLHSSMDSFFLERKEAFLNETFFATKKLALSDLSILLEQQKLNPLTVIKIVQLHLATSLDVTNKFDHSFALLKTLIAERNCINLLQTEAVYKTELLNLETNHILQSLN
uniref:ATP synthase F0 subunit b n=1 Tax=Tsukubamonas globosa TaxID=875863 RepID=W8VRC3_9EUKA|nr:hypothetical protein [Tsukubamonas globosa]BAO51984.1 hypothetical protein [Tsukubamonas globosa]